MLGDEGPSQHLGKATSGGPLALSVIFLVDFFGTTLLLFLYILEEKTISRKDASDALEVLMFSDTACLASS